jgi:hypothetical protein
MYSAMTLYANGGASKTKLAESHRKWENELSRKNDITLLCWCYPKRCHAEAIRSSRQWLS